ncbi:MAG: VOC family protein [Euryarchaeota archaeon]|nr:VOC family protein [Euryarchaeota archaeon]
MRFLFGYTGLRVVDLEANIRFFTQGLGMRLREGALVKETGGTLVELVAGDASHFLELNYYPPGNPYATPYSAGEALDHLNFKVEGGKLDDAIETLEKAGGKLVIPPFREGGGRLAYVNSPDGHTVELREPAP